MSTKTLAEAKSDRDATIERNRARPVTEYPSKQKLSDQVWEVTEGLKHVPDGSGKRMNTLTPGMRFRPTEAQVKQTASGRGGLLNKARELNRSEYAGISLGKRNRSTGADIGLRALSMAEGTLRAAMDGGLTEQDFEGVVPGHGGKFTREQVDDLIALKNSGDPN